MPRCVVFRQKLVKLSEFTLLVMDECHHAVKNDPYNDIMKLYLDVQLETLPVGERREKLPQVAGKIKISRTVCQCYRINSPFMKTLLLTHTKHV